MKQHICKQQSSLFECILKGRDKLKVGTLIIYSVFFLLFSHQNLNGQISIGGIPPSFSDSSISDSVPVVQMASLNVDSLIQSDTLNDFIFRFGYAFDVDLNLNNSGRWDTLSNGDKIWRLKLFSEDAFSLNLIFDDWSLPPGALFYVYSEDRNMILGAFNDSVSNNQDNVFAIDLVKGKSIILELYEPDNISGSTISINKVIHGYRDVFSSGQGTAGSCHIDVNCIQGDEWCMEKRTVSMILINNNTAFCSGCLINNVRQDMTPYYLTANHCLNGSEKTWIFRFKYWSPSCNVGERASHWVSITGATVRAKSARTDFALLELSSRPPATYGIAYAGWERSSEAATSSAAIHHPYGDVMKISRNFNSLTGFPWVSGAANNHWRAEFNEGTVQNGSSGSPLFNQNRRIVGQLHGNQNNQCWGKKNTSSCHCSQTPIGEYGMFHISWDGADTPEERLMEWLDPDGTDAMFTNTILATPAMIPGGSHYNFGGKFDNQLLSTSVNVFGDMYVNGNIALSNPASFGALPFNNSFFLLILSCASTVDVNNNARLIIGAPERGLRGKMVVSNDATLILESGSVLLIHDNSSLVIESGGILEIHPGAQVILNGTNALLEIKGQIRLMQDADFTVEGGNNGFGYLRFHKNMNNNPLLLVGNGQNNINLTGNGTTHRLIEITGTEGWLVPPSIVNVNISNCLITLGGGSRLNMEIRNFLSVNNVEINKISANQSRHKGLYIWGWGMYSEIDNLTVNGGIQGIYYYPIHNHHKFTDADLMSVSRSLKIHTVRNSRFTDNITGIKAVRVPVWLIDNVFDGYHSHGVRTYGTLAYNNFMINNLFNNSQSGIGALDTGVSFWGPGTFVKLHFRKNEVTGNRQGVYGFNTGVIAGCNNIHNNLMTALVMEGRADLYMDDAYSTAGHNMIVNNNSNIISRYYGRTSIKNGFNYFFAGNSYSYLEIPFYIFGIVNSITQPPYLYPVENNHFSPPLVPTLPPVTWSDWSTYINHARANSITAYIYNRDNPAVFGDIGPVNSFVPESSCNDPLWYEMPGIANGVPVNELYPYYNAGDQDGASEYVIITPDYQFTPLKDAFANLYLRGIELNNESPAQVLSAYEDVFLISYSPVDTLRDVFYELYNQMLGHVADWINSGAVVTRVNDTLTEDPVFSQLMNFLDSMIARSSLNASHFLYGQEFNIQLEKIELMRAASNYQEALQLIDNLVATVTEPIQFFILEKLHCLSSAEKALLAGEVSPDSLFEVYGFCLDAYFDDPDFASVSNDLILNSQQEDFINNNSGIQIWPNPAQDQLNINVLTENVYPEFKIYNLVGNELHSGKLQPGLQQINLRDLSNGIYIIKIHAEDKMRSYKFVVMK